MFYFQLKLGSEAMKRKLLRALGEKLFWGTYKKGKRRFFCLVSIRGLILTSNIKELKNNADDRNLNV